MELKSVHYNSSPFCAIAFSGLVLSLPQSEELSLRPVGAVTWVSGAGESGTRFPAINLIYWSVWRATKGRIFKQFSLRYGSGYLRLPHRRFLIPPHKKGVCGKGWKTSSPKNACVGGYGALEYGIIYGKFISCMKTVVSRSRILVQGCFVSSLNYGGKIDQKLSFRVDKVHLSP